MDQNQRNRYYQYMRSHHYDSDDSQIKNSYSLNSIFNQLSTKFYSKIFKQEEKLKNSKEAEQQDDIILFKRNTPKKAAQFVIQKIENYDNYQGKEYEIQRIRQKLKNNKFQPYNNNQKLILQSTPPKQSKLNSIQQNAQEIQQEKLKPKVLFQDENINQQIQVYKSESNQLNNFKQKFITNIDQIKQHIKIPNIQIDHESFPFIINNYALVMFRVFFILLLICITISFTLQVKDDLQRKLQTENLQIQQEIDKCYYEYYLNKCQPNERVQALETYCSDREICMNRDPQSINKNLKILVKLIAELINDFFDPLSYKTIFLIILTLILSRMLSECLFKNQKFKKSDKIVEKTQ